MTINNFTKTGNPADLILVHFQTLLAYSKDSIIRYFIVFYLKFAAKYDTRTEVHALIGRNQAVSRISTRASYLRRVERLQLNMMNMGL